MDSVSTQVVIQSIPVILVVLALVLSVYRHRSAAAKKAMGIQLMQALRQLVAHVQKHRGLSSAVAAGERSLQSGLEQAKLEVSRDFKAIAELSDWIKTQPEWDGITQHWARLAGSQRLVVPVLIEQHSRMIANILALVDETARTHFLLDSRRQSVTTWRTLLSLAELMGQVRANGTAYLSETDSLFQSKTRNKLQSLIQEIIQILEMLRYGDGMDREYVQEIVDFLAHADEYMFLPNAELTAAEFFGRATQIIDGLYERFDVALVHLR